jgi:predicted Zn finger-like uncharacterized protein
MFKVECPGCRAPYQVDERRVPSSGLKMRCPKCTTSFKVEPPSGGVEGGSVLGAALGATAPKVGAAAPAPPQRRPGATMLGVAPAQVSAPPPNVVVPSDLPAVAGETPSDDLPVRADVDRTVPLAGGPPAAAPKAPPPVPPRKARPPSPAVAATAVTEPSLSLDLDLPAPAAARRVQEPLARPTERQATPRVPERAAERAAGGSIDLDLPSIVTLPPSADLPNVRGGRAPAAAPAARSSHQEIELDLPSPSADLPARGSVRPGGSLPPPGRDLPVPLAGLPAAQVGLPAPHAGLPLPAAGLPSPAAGLPLASAGLPSPSASLPTPGPSLPVTSAGFPMRSPSLPAAFGGLPSPGASQSESSGFSLTPPATLGDLDLPPMPPETPGLGARLGFDEPAREADPFGEAELPPPRSLREESSPTASLPPSGAGGLIRQEGGGTSYGEVNLGGDSTDFAIEARQPPTSARAQGEDMEFQAVPQEKGQARPSDAKKPLEPAVPAVPLRTAPPSRGMGMKVFVGVCLALASGGSLALLPDIGPFGAHWIVDQMRSSEYDALIQNTIGSTRKRFGADTAPEATRAWSDADQARAQAKRLKPLRAYAAFVGYQRELRFGSAPEIHARANVLLDEFEPQADVQYLLLARAARAATEGQLARARQSLGSLLAVQRGNVDALVLSGEVELRAKNNKAALEAWQAVAKLENSARAVFGLARAEFWSGDLAKAELHAKEALEKNPNHVGGKILLARIASSDRKTEPSAIQTLESITQQGALASSEELVNAFTLLGDIHLGRSRISKAEIAYGAALKLEPKAPGSLRGLGEALFRAGRYSEAQARFEAGAQADPDDLDAKVGVAKSKFMLERVEDANESLNKLSEAHPKSVLAAYWRGRVLEARGERELAEKSYRVAIEQKVDADPMLVEAYIALALLENQQGKADAAFGTLNAARERFPSTPAIHRALGDVALTQGRYAEARTEFDRALALDPEDLATRFRLGVALRRDSKFDDAIQAFDAVAAIDSEYPGLALERGLLYEASGRTELALKQYEEARAKAPNDPDLLLRVGCGYASAGRTKEAEDLLRKVLALRPTSAETQHCLGRALLAEGSRLADALRLLERATELDPHRAEYYLFVGWAANEAGNVTKAQRALDEAIKLDQGLADAYWQRGVLRSRQGAVKDAMADLTRALSLKPSRHEAHAALADVYYDLGQETLALSEWQKAVEAQPDHATWRFRYGKLLAANHKNEAARTELSRALELAEKFPHGERWLWEAHHLLARVLGAKPEAAPHWEAFLRLGPLDSPYRAEAKAILERLGRPWTGN